MDNLNNDIQNLYNILNQATEWSIHPATPNEEVRINEDAQLITQLATAVLSVSNQLSDPGARTLAERVTIRKALTDFRREATGAPYINQRIGAVITAVNSNLDPVVIKDMMTSINSIIESIDEWEILHFEDNEAEWELLPADHRETHVATVRNYLEEVLLSFDTLHQLQTNPEMREAWTARLRRLMEKFPELRDNLDVTNMIWQGNWEAVKVFIALGASVPPNTLNEVISADHFELANVILERLEREEDLHLLSQSFPEKLSEIPVPRDPEGAVIFSRLIQLQKKLGDLRAPLDDEVVIDILSAMCDQANSGITDYGPVALEFFHLFDHQQMQNALADLDTNDFLLEQCFKKFDALLPPSPQANPSEALAYFNVWCHIPNRLTLMPEIGTPLRNYFLPIFQDPALCGDMLTSLGDQFPVLFELDPAFGVALERDGTPLIKWLKGNNEELKGNNWWRDQDPNWFSAEMTREIDADGNSHLYRAAANRAYDLIQSLPIDILRNGIGRRNRTGWTPLMRLVRNSPTKLVEFNKALGTFKWILDKIGPIARKNALLEISTKKDNLLHKLLDPTPIIDLINPNQAYFIAPIAQYRDLFLEMLLTKDHSENTPLRKTVEIVANPKNKNDLDVCFAITQETLKSLNIPANAEDVLQPSTTFVPWLTQQLKDHPSNLSLLMLPLLRGQLEELTDALKGNPDVCTQWLAHPETIKSLLSFPEEILQTILTIRDEKGNTPLEYLALLGDVQFWQTIANHDYELPLTFLRQPEKYGSPLHRAAEAGHVDFLRTVIIDQNEDAVDVQRELIGLRNAKKQTPIQAAEAAKREDSQIFFFKEIEIPMLDQEYQQMMRMLDREIPPPKQITSLAEMRSEAIRLRLKTLQMLSDYFKRLTASEQELSQREPMRLMLPSLKMIEKGSIESAYMQREVVSQTIKEASQTVNFTEVLLPLIEQLPIDGNALIADLEHGVDGRRHYDDVKTRLIAFIRGVGSEERVKDAYGQDITPQFKAQIANVLRHVARYVEDAQEEIFVAPPEEAQVLLDQLNKEMREELIGDFAIGLFHCLDGVAMHTRQLYNFVSQSQANTLENQLLIALHQYRSNQFTLIVSQVAAGNIHEASTHRYYRAELGEELGLDGAMEGSINPIYSGFAVRNQQAKVRNNFNLEHTPIKLVDYVCGLLDDPKDKTLNKAWVLDWFSQNFSSKENPLCEEQIFDENRKWKPEAIGLFLTAMGIIKPKTKEVNEKRILMLTLEQGDLTEIRNALSNYQGELPEGLLHAALNRGDPEILKDVVRQHKTRGSLTKAYSEVNKHGQTGAQILSSGGNFVMVLSYYLQQ